MIAFVGSRRGLHQTYARSETPRRQKTVCCLLVGAIVSESRITECLRCCLELTQGEFASRLSSSQPGCLVSEVAVLLYLHYQELRRWSARTALIGPGVAERAVEYLYGESAAAVFLLPGAGKVVDIGSGAGFPGWVLAALRPDMEVWLIEPRQKKAAFLRSVTAKASLSCSVLGARVGRSLPSGFPEQVDVMTVRALKPSREEWDAIVGALAPTGRILRWAGPDTAEPPSGLLETRRQPITGSERFIQELGVAEPGREVS